MSLLDTPLRDSLLNTVVRSDVDMAIRTDGAAGAGLRGDDESLHLPRSFKGTTGISPNASSNIQTARLYPIHSSVMEDDHVLS